MAKTIYLARRNTDLTEGRGTMKVEGAFFCEATARHCMEMLPGIMGTTQGRDVMEMRVFDSFAEWSGEREEGLRKQAMAKLSAEERRALGL